MRSSMSTQYLQTGAAATVSRYNYSTARVVLQRA